MLKLSSTHFVFALIVLSPASFSAYASLEQQSGTCSSVPSINITPLTSPIRLSTEPADSSSPLLFSKDEIIAFVSSWNHKTDSTYNHLTRGSSLENLNSQAVVDVSMNPSLRWIEGVHKTEDGSLIAWYHTDEDPRPCGEGEGDNDLIGPGLREPHIGTFSSQDGGYTWTQGERVLSAKRQTADCSSQNGFFAGGHGDPWILVDQAREYVYMYYTNYSTDSAAPQGVSVARLAYKDLKDQTGKWRKFKNGGWSESGVEGGSSPIFPVKKSWKEKQPDAFWGPSIYFDKKSNYYIMILNRTKDRDNWGPEGVYYSYTRDLANPLSWSEPQKIFNEGNWYPQLVDPSTQDYTAIDGEAYFFQQGTARHRLTVTLACPQE